MPRSLSAGQITALQTEPFKEEFLIEITNLTTSPIYWTTNPQSSVSATAQSTGTTQTFLTSKVNVVGSVTDTLDGTVNTLNISVATSTAAEVTTWLLPDGSSSKYWFNAVVYVSVAIRDPSTNAIVGSPILLFKGTVTDFNTSSGNDSSGFSFTIQSEFADFNKSKGRKTSDASMDSYKTYFAGYVGSNFRYISNRSPLKWGDLSV